MIVPVNGRAQVEAWFAGRGWSPRSFQRETWEAFAKGHCGLVQVSTGAGKTYAAYGAALADWLDQPESHGLHTLYLTPLRAMTRDLEKALCEISADLAPALVVEARTGDTSPAVRARQRKRLPHVLLTTPESLTLLLSHADTRERFRGVRAIIVDEWHDLLASKRGTQTELALARLRAWSPGVRTWALSATLADPLAAARTVVGVGREPVLVREQTGRRLEVRTILPGDIRELPWAGNLGIRLLPEVLREIDPRTSALLFTNTRAQAEMWFDAIRTARPKWSSHMALHHGSLDREDRARVEQGLKDGSLRLVVSTSSLDLGVDFSPVEQVFQIGSPKGIARLLQRGGRAKHRPGISASTVLCVPTHTLQIVEFAAARAALEKEELERLEGLPHPIDALCQHLVTVGLGGGFSPDALFEEIRSAWSYRALPRTQFDWVIDHLETGGQTLRAYDEHHRLKRTEDGRLEVPKLFARRHRANIGTITSDGMIEVCFVAGRSLGMVEEAFVARLKPGEVFLFSGRALQYVRFRDMRLEVKVARRRPNHVPHYAGGRLPLSNQLSAALRRELDAAARGLRNSPELRALDPIFTTQRDLSALPRANEILVEACASRDGFHCFIFPFEGRLVHEGLAALLAYRLSRCEPASFILSTNDYGFELAAETPFPFAAAFADDARAALLTEDNLLGDTLASINLGELARRQFRTIARIAGLVFEGYPHARKSARQLQSSSGLIYDVFARFDPANLLLQQARAEVLEACFEQTRLVATLARMRAARWIFRETERPTPLSRPLLLERQSAELSAESPATRIARLRREPARPTPR